MITALAVLRWLLNVENLIGVALALLLGLVAGFLKGHAIATVACDTRVTAAVTSLQKQLDAANDKRASDALDAGDKAPQLPLPFFHLPSFHHDPAPAPLPPAPAAAPLAVARPADSPARARALRLCASDPDCRGIGHE